MLLAILNAKILYDIDNQEEIVGNLEFKISLLEKIILSYKNDTIIRKSKEKYIPLNFQNLMHNISRIKRKDIV